MPIEKRRYIPPTVKPCPFGEDVLTASGDVMQAFKATWLGGDEPTETSGEWTQ